MASAFNPSVETFSACMRRLIQSGASTKTTKKACLGNRRRRDNIHCYFNY